MLRKFGIALLTIATLAAAPTPVTRHMRDVVANGQARAVGRLSPTEPMRLVLVLQHRNQAELDNFLKDLYDPASPSYRHFLSVEEFTARFGPTQEDYDAVVRFAETHGLRVVGTSRNRLNVDVQGTVANIETALHLNMGVFQHPTENRTFYAPDREPTPDLEVKLWHIAGLDNYSIPRPALVTRNPNATPEATTGSCPQASFCGSDMRAAYYGGTALTGAGQTLGLLEYVGTDLADLNTYYQNAHQTLNVPVTLLSTDGTSTACLASAGCDDTEQTLDMTQALGMAPGLARLVMYVGSTDSAIFNAMATASPLNAQLSSSWTWSPADPATDDPYFQEFAGHGQNLFQAAGDSGAWTRGSSVFPADDPYLTTVGGTDLTTSSAGGPWSSETVWVDGGGGIAPDKYAIPSWQTAAAAGCAKCSQTYRNGPDVSANSNFTFYVCANQTTCTANSYGGTSFAAPMWAGYLALANQQVVAGGGSALGFINPSLYALGLASDYTIDFHDIISGSNGYSATTGYDLATGWGSPNGSGLIDALNGPPPPPGFFLSASPASVTVTQGGSGTSTITSTATGGFDSAVALSASGQPTGVTVGFSPGSITGTGTSTMTMNVAASTVPGTYPITVTGTSGSITETTTVSLTVAGPNPNFKIGASPATITVARNSAGTTKIVTTVSGGFNAAIGLSNSLLGSALGVTFTPTTIAAPGAGKSTMTVKVSKSAALGNHTITVTGKGGGLSHSTTVTVNVVQ